MKLHSYVGVLHSDKTCSKENCKNRLLVTTYRKRKKDDEKRKLTLRCNSCQTFQSIFDGTFFSLFRKRLFVLLLIINCWSVELTISKALSLLVLEDVEITRQTIGDLYQKLSCACSVQLNKLDIKIGGKNLVVEIDETLIMKVKYNRYIENI